MTLEHIAAIAVIGFVYLSWQIKALQAHLEEVRERVQRLPSEGCRVTQIERYNELMRGP